MDRCQRSSLRGWREKPFAIHLGDFRATGENFGETRRNVTETTADYRLRLILDATIDAIESGKDMRETIWKALVTTDEHARLSTLTTVEAGERSSLPMTKKEMERTLWAVTSRHLPTPVRRGKKGWYPPTKPNWYQIEE